MSAPGTTASLTSPPSSLKVAVLGSGYDRTKNACGVGVRPKREG